MPMPQQIGCSDGSENVMPYTVTAGDLSALHLNETDTVAAVLQNIKIILTTQRGSVPMYRDFGIPMDFLDQPMPVAKAKMIAAVREAVEKWEPRAKVLSMAFREDASQPGKLIPALEVEINAP